MPISCCSQSCQVFNPLWAGNWKGCIWPPLNGKGSWQGTTETKSSSKKDRNVACKVGIRLCGFIRMYCTLLFDHYHVAMCSEKHLAMVTFSFCSTGAPPSSVLGSITVHRKTDLRLFNLNPSVFKCKYCCFKTSNSFIFWKSPHLNIVLQASYGAEVVWVRLNKQTKKPTQL